jgi:hypothetical protein
MTRTPSVTAAVIAKLDLKKDDPRLFVPRNANILRHYQRQLDLGRMDYDTAIDRSITDMKGWNYHNEREQRSDIKLGSD